MIRLDELERLATQAIDFDASMDRFKDSCDPETILALVRIAREAKKIADCYDDEDWLSNDLKKALKGVSCSPISQCSMSERSEVRDTNTSMSFTHCISQAKTNTESAT